MSSEEEPQATDPTDSEGKQALARSLVDEVSSLGWNLDSIGPKLSDALQIERLSDELFDHGRLRSPVRGSFLEWRSHWRLRRFFEDRLLTEAGEHLSEVREKFESLRTEIAEFRQELADFKERHGYSGGGLIPLDVLGRFEPRHPWIVGPRREEIDLDANVESLRQRCIDEWRIVRILERRPGYSTLVGPREPLRDREASEVLWAFTSDLPPPLLEGLGAVSAPNPLFASATESNHVEPGIKSRRDLEKAVDEWFGEQVDRGVDLRPKSTARAAMWEQAAKLTQEFELSERATLRIWASRALPHWKEGGRQPRRPTK